MAIQDNSALLLAETVFLEKIGWSIKKLQRIAMTSYDYYPMGFFVSYSNMWNIPCKTGKNDKMS